MSTTNFGFGKPTNLGDEDGWGTILNTTWDDMDSTLKTISDKVADLAVNRNYLINPCFIISQEFANSAPALSSGSYFADMFYDEHFFSSVSVSRYDSAMDEAGYNNKTPYAIKYENLSAIPSLGAGDYVGFMTAIEGYDYVNLHGQSAMTLSFMVKSSKSGTYSVSFENGDTDRMYLTEYSITADDTWEKISITVPPDTSGTWHFDHQTGLRLRFTMMAGIGLVATATGSWDTYTAFAGANQVNWADTSTATFYMTQLKLEPGSIATEYVSRFYHEELLMCERYYEKSYLHDKTPASSNTTFGQQAGISVGTDTYTACIPVNFRTKKRATPSVTIYNPITGSTNSMRTLSGTNVSASPVAAGEHGFWAKNNATTTDATLHFIHFVADARLS